MWKRNKYPFCCQANKYNVIPNRLYALLQRHLRISKLRRYWIKEQKINKNNNQAKRASNRSIKNAEYDNYDKVFTFDHLCNAAKKCRNNVGWKGSVQTFMNEMYSNVEKIYNDLENRTFRITHKYNFSTYERGKLRAIQSVHIRERVVQRCLCDYCLTPILEPTFTYDNCASQKNKGTHFALQRLKRHLQKYYNQYGSDGYVLKFDIHDYFGTINRDLLMSMLRKYITDQDLLSVIQLFLDEYTDPLGIGLGSQISQVLSLFYLSPVDHLIKDRLRMKYYVRYMDDGIIICNDKAELEAVLAAIKEMLATLGLELSPKKTTICKLSHITFLQKRISLLDNGRIVVKISRQSITRERRKLKKLITKWKAGEVKYRHVISSYKAWKGTALKFDAYSTVKSMDELFYRLVLEGDDQYNEVCEGI